MEVSAAQYAMLTSPAEFMLVGGAAGAGKSMFLILDPLRHCQGGFANPLFRGSLFRKTYPQLTQAGGLLDMTRQFYAPLGAVFNQTRSEWTFPCGAKIGLNTLQYERDIEEYLGAQWDWVGIDEAAAFTLKNVMFLWSRCRSKSGIKPTLRMTANPDNDSFLFKLIYDWLNEDGYPIPEKSGVIKHFTTNEEEFIWSDEPQLNDKGDKISTSFTFIPSKLVDNAFLMKSDPQYFQRLMALPKQDRERFLQGCWLASSKTDCEWPAELFMNVYIPDDHFPVPQQREVVRFFTVDASKGRTPKRGDYSAIVCLAQTQDLAYIDADLQRRPPGQIVQDLFTFCDDPLHRIRSGDLIGVETSQFQELFRDLIMIYARDNPDYALSAYLNSGNMIIQVEDMLNKMMRIRRLDRPIRNRSFRFRQNPGTTLLLQQLKTFDGIPAVGKHDDGPDALDMANQLPRHREEMYKRMREGKM